MQTIRTLLMMKHNGLSDQQVADSLKIAKGSVNAFYNRYKASGKALPVPADFPDSELRDIIYPSKPAFPRVSDPDWSSIESQLSRPGVTLQLLWEEYAANHTDGLGRTAFYDGYKQYRKNHDLSMVVIHKGGEKLFVDYSGDGLSYVDRETGEVISLQVFVSAWGASGYAFVDVTRTQSKEDWVESHVRAFEYYNCVSALLVPDNLKAGVLKPDLYEPTLNPLYEKLAEHYGASVLPARVRKPKDKAVVESCVLQVQRRVLAPLRDRTFFSMDEARTAVLEALEQFNARPMKDHEGKSRRERFVAMDRPEARALPQDRFSITSMKIGVLVQKNYHVSFGEHYYSVPHTLVGKRIDIHQVGGILEIYSDGIHICRHARSTSKNRYTTIDEHMPANHAFAKGTNPVRLIFAAGEIGPQTAIVAKAMLEQKRHPEQAFKSVQGVIGLNRLYGKERLEMACARAVHFDAIGYMQVKSILEKGLDKQEYDNPTPTASTVSHENVRGPAYYAQDAQGGV